MRAILARHPKAVRAIRIALGLGSLFALGLGVRRVVLNAQYVKLGRDFPFTLESALHYRRVKIIHDTGTMPEVDPVVGAPEGVNVRRTYEFGSERIQALLSRALPRAWPMGDRLRWIEAGWYCLAIPLLALWLWWWLGDWKSGAVAAALYAVSIAAVMRSTGHELSKENFALPLLVAHLALGARSMGRTGRSLHVYAAASALFLGWSLWNWDLIQFYVGLWALQSAWSAMRGGWERDPAVSIRWGWNATALLLVGAASPYFRAHGFLLSPPMLIVYAVGLREVCARRLPAAWRLHVRPWQIAALGLLAASLLCGLTSYGQAYGHFGDLLWAKLRHLNSKPADPALLTFAQRIMWVPALNSATWGLTLQLFPVSLWLAVGAVVAAVRNRRPQNFPACPQLLFYFLASLVAFVFFVRFQVFVALFASALLGWWFGRTARSGGAAFVALGVAVAFAWTAEFARVVNEPERWGRGNVYYREMVELNRWLREHAAPDTVVANFGISGAIAAYGKCAVVLHPKFEEPEIRDRVRAYGEQLFKGTELSLRDWADGLGADYLVYAKGEFSDKAPELQMRYFVDALKPGTNCPAWRFEFRPTDTRWFHYRWSNHKYAVYKILTKADEQSATRHGRQAWAELARNDLDGAELDAVVALQLNPDEPVAQEVLRRVGIRRSGKPERGGP